MKRSTTRNAPVAAFERTYATALAKHARNGRSGRNGKASREGARVRLLALDLGIGVLDLARIHDRAVVAAALPRGSDALGDAFFCEVVAPSEEPSAGNSEALLACTRLAAKLGRRTGELAAARARLARETVKGKSLQAELTTSERHQGESRDRAKVMEGRLRQLTRRLLTAQEDERLRISRDLHDAIGQELTGINVGLAALKQGAAADSRDLATAITLTQQLVERSMRTVHHYAWELRPTLLDDLGLGPALRSYTKAFSSRTGIPVRFVAGAKAPRPDNERGLALFRVAQGALSNVERHARAKHVRISLRSTADAVRLEVSDDGRAFDLRKMETAKKERNLGLLVMRERVEMVGGTFSIISTAGRGTTVRAEVPPASKAAHP